jgi:predicted dehydrogenase/FAD/FMN-containing dehydrogenase
LTFNPRLSDANIFRICDPASVVAGFGVLLVTGARFIFDACSKTIRLGSVGPFPSRRTASLSRPLKIGLVGCGWFAREAHVPALRKLESAKAVEVVALCSLSAQSMDRVSTLLGRDVTRFMALQDLLRMPGLDAVDLTLPIPAMASAIRESLKAGKHVISEKPCAGALTLARDLIDYHVSLPVAPRWAVAENWRFKPIVGLLRQLVLDDTIGELQTADFRHVTRRDPSNLGWRNTSGVTGGPLLDSGVHFIAMLRQVVGEITQVSALVSQRERQSSDPDTVGACLKFATGADGLFRLSFANLDARNRSGLVLVGSQGSATVDFLRSEVTIDVGKRARTVKVKADPWVQGGVFELLEHCVASINAGTPFRCTPTEAAADMAVIESMALASRTHRIIAPGALFPLGEASRPLVRTYDRLRDFRPRSLVSCASVDEVRAAVLDASTKGLRVRAKGNGLSWAPHVTTRGVSIALDGLNRIGEFDAKRASISVEAGVRLGNLTRTLAAQGLAIPSLSFLSDASIGGAIATATHGTSPRWGTLSDFVEAVTLVLPSGEARVVDGAADQELRAARASIGMLGIIVSIELRVIPIPTVRFSKLHMSLDDFLRRRHEITARYDHVWVNWTLGRNEVEVDCLEECSRSDANGHPYVMGDNAVWQSIRSAPSVLHRIRRKLRAVGGRVASRVSHRLNGHKPRIDNATVSMQYGLPLSDMDSAVAEIATSSFAHVNKGRSLELKFLAGSSKTMLGPNSGGDSVLFNMWWQVERSKADHAFDTFEQLMISRKAKPHWGKQHRPPTIAYMREAYAEWEAFARIKEQFDPQRVFSIFDEERAAVCQSSSSGH